MGVQGRLVGVVSAHCRPRLPGNAQDDKRDRKTDERISDRGSERDDDRGGNHGEADIGVRAGMVPVSDERRTIESLPGTQAYARRDEIAGIADRAGKRECRQMGRSGGMNKSADGLDARHARTSENGGYDGQAGASLRDLGVQSERDPEWHGGQRITEVVDQVGQQSDAAAGDEHEGLSDGGEPQDCE